MVKVAIVEDEQEASDVLLSHFKRYEKENGTEFHTAVFRDAVTFLTGYTPDYDMVLMDIELPNLNGMNASKKLRELDRNVTLIFVTNMAQYAIKGYEVEASDFIVKPVFYYDFKLKLKRALDRIDLSGQEGRIAVKVDDAVRCLNAVDIKYVEVIKHNIIYHLQGGGELTAYGTLKEIEQKLPASSFSRCNHCYLVNLRYVTDVKDFTVTVGGERLLISHPKKKDFVKALNDYLGSK